MRNIFENLFVLELANNHLGQVERGISMINEFAHIVRHNNVRAAIKLQFRNIETFVHPDYQGSNDLIYIKKTSEKKLSKEEYKILVNKIREKGCIPMSTPFDEDSVNLCDELDLPIIKIASSDINDWPLIEQIAKTNRPVIASTGGAKLKEIDDIVHFFEKRKIPFALNHCVSHYPTEDFEQELNQIDFLRNRYPNITIGHSTHEYHDWHDSMLIAYAKGARTFERHIDIPIPGEKFKKYNSTPAQIDKYFKAFHRVVELCGNSSNSKRQPTLKEVNYLTDMVRGIYARQDIDPGLIITNDNFNKYFYLAVPLHKGQLSVKEIINGDTLIQKISKHEQLRIAHVDSPFKTNKDLKRILENRGI